METEKESLFSNIVKDIVPLEAEASSANPVQKARYERALRLDQKALIRINPALRSEWDTRFQEFNKVTQFSYSMERSFFEPVAPESYLYYQNSGIQSRKMKLLKRGDIKWEGSFDLHGYTLKEAAEALDQFIESAKQQKKKCVKLIHGKGRPFEAIACLASDVERPQSLNKINQRAPANTTPLESESKPIIKSAINHWLRQDHRILAFCSAPPKDGGTGAIYVLLKNK